MSSSPSAMAALRSNTHLARAKVKELQSSSRGAELLSELLLGLLSSAEHPKGSMGILLHLLCFHMDSKIVKMVLIKWLCGKLHSNKETVVILAIFAWTIAPHLWQTSCIHSFFFPAAFANICMCVRFHIKDFLFFSLFHIFFHFM